MNETDVVDRSTLGRRIPTACSGGSRSRLTDNVVIEPQKIEEVVSRRSSEMSATEMERVPATAID
jgi:hypothetical protein